jgi:hypothetical protein
MSASSGPSIQTNGLTFLMDVANPACINASSCVGYNNATQLIKNLIRPSDVNSSSSTLRLGNLTYFTAFAIDYPESSYGGAAASRQGLTPGFNVTSGTKTYDASRALHLWVWNNDTSNWVADSFFTGERLNGHCYDSYVGTAEVDKWVVDFNKIKNTFKSITVIAMGSHRDSYHTTAQYEILRDLGAPSDVDSIIGFSSPEWILVGQPGIGAGNGAWSFQNYSTDPSLVAHMNFGIPFKGNTNNYLNFNGSSDFISLPNAQIIGPSAGTVSAIINIPSAQSDYNCIFTCETGPDWNNLRTWLSMFGANQIRFTVSNGSDSTQNGCVSSALSYNTIYHVTGTYDGTTVRIYLNGVLNASHSSSIVPGTFTPTMVRIGHHYDTRYFGGSIYLLNVYNRALTAAEIQQSFNAQRTRYGI